MSFRLFTFCRYLRELKRKQWLKASDLQESKLKRLGIILKHAYENVRFYHQMFDSVGIKPTDIKDPDDLSKLPITTKLDVQRNFPHGVIAEDTRIEQCARRTTSGSTGIPLTILFDRKAINYRWAQDTLPMLECGLRLLDKQIVVQVRDPHHFWFEKMGVWRCRHLPIAVRPEKNIQLLREFRPAVVRGYPTYLQLLAKVMREKETKEICPRLVFTVSELLDKWGRAFIGSAFGAEVYDLYGCWEFGNLAWECCEHSGYHISDGVLMEFVKDGEVVGPGERGEVICTGLYNRAMPLIRYRLGDVAVPEGGYCACGRGSTLMKIVEGRLDDFVTTPKGRIFTPGTLTIPLQDIAGISQFRIVQEKRDKLVIQLVPGANFSPNTIDDVVRVIKRVVGEEGISILVEAVTEMPRDQSGKLRKIISHVPFSLS